MKRTTHLPGVAINLLPKKTLNVRERLLFFALHYLRYIIVLTQTTVIMVFFYRFQVDQRIIDLREDVSQKQEILKVTAPLVAEAQSTEKRLTQVQKLLLNESSFSNLYSFILANVSDQIILSELTLGDKNVTIKGQASTIQSVQRMYQGLLQGKTIQDVTVADISKSIETQTYQFTIVGIYE